MVGFGPIPNPINHTSEELRVVSQGEIAETEFLGYGADFSLTLYS